MNLPTGINIISGILINESKVLLGLRKNTKHFPDCWSLPVGHVEEGESPLQTLKRELTEELGIEVLSASSFCIKTDKNQSIVHQVFKVEKWNGEPANLEPDLCSQLKWFLLDDLPENLTPVSKEILVERAFLFNSLMDKNT